MINIDRIMEALPHRYPFLLVDRILEVEEERVVGLKNVSINEPFFQGHFPGEPVMPGVLILEAMGQVAAMMIICRPNMGDMITYLTGVDKARFRRPVRPGDQLITTAEIKKVRGRVGKVWAKAEVDGELAAEAEYSFIMAERLSGKTTED
ncbi:MAG TPA: 3-hydroxyacyl-[acyl-carrier-protein] dehydratase FabZ [Aminobacterium sp.]|jgi:3-hydroxyacyl-[acyl-carrier-protein] dehydratase|uniref:3-hydroxyacyl-ACP dehydratase FabZ n=1 Tax=Aminobacterium TaxID=81466 RepID=UPI00046596D0|nr:MULTISPECIES: 3-hydroxyacyl-ACP dehydratase FabZ [Aminobacterium]HCA40405.1 3-hydroxyacyl-[acyl-carrier-protein] dehydratase FabZ [Aminobacterium sp.]